MRGKTVFTASFRVVSSNGARQGPRWRAIIGRRGPSFKPSAYESCAALARIVQLDDDVARAHATRLLGGVGAEQLELVEIVLGHVLRHVLAGEHRAVEAFDL